MYCAEHGAVLNDHACDALPAEAYKAFSEWNWKHDRRAEPFTPQVCFLAGWRQALARPPAPDAGARVIEAARRVAKGACKDHREWVFAYEYVVHKQAMEDLIAALDALDGDADARGEGVEPDDAPADERAAWRAIQAAAAERIFEPDRDEPAPPRPESGP